MKTGVLKNVRELLTLMYPCIMQWAQNCDYSIPSITILSGLKLQFLDCSAFESTYNGNKISAIGAYFYSAKRIDVAAKRDHGDVMTTIIHELSHAVQFFNLDKEFHTQYSAEAYTNPRI